MVLPPLKGFECHTYHRSFDAFTKTLCVGYDNVTLVFDFIGGRLGSCSAPITNLSGGHIKSFLHLVQSPFGIFAFSESLPEMVLVGATQACCTLWRPYGRGCGLH